MHTMKRYLQLFFVFAKFSLMSQLEYRINFIAGIGVEMGYLLVKLSYVAVICQAGVSIHGMSPDNILIFIGTYIFMTGIYMAFYPNFVAIPNHVREGGLDMYITKPVNLQFITTLKQVDFGMPIPNVTGGLILIGIGWSRSGLPVNFVQLTGFFLLVLCSILLTYSLFLIPHLFAFWFVAAHGVMEVTAAIWDFNNMPMNIYGKWLQRLGTFVLPLFLITNFPGLFAMQRLNPGMFLWGLIAPVLFFLLSRWIWNRAVRRYTSASS